MRPETELLILCASPLRSERNSARIREILDLPLDWTFLQDSADFHRLTPVLCWTLQSLKPSIIPPRLAGDFKANARKSLLLTAELTRILDLLDHGGVTALPFKGPTLAISAFDNPTLRSFDDLDLLVSRADVWRARDILLAAGYVETVELGAHREDALLESYDELVLRGPRGFPLVEIHWSFLPPHFSVPLNTAAFLTRHGSISLGNRTIPSLRPEDLLLVLSLHGAKHCWSRLSLVCDIAWLMSAVELDWDAVLADARRLRVVRMLLLAIALPALMFGTTVPRGLVHLCEQDRRVPALADTVICALFGTPHDETAILSSASLHLKMREDVRDKLRYILRLAARPGIEDWQAVNLPARLSFLYPALRLPRLAWKYLRRP